MSLKDDASWYYSLIDQLDKSKAAVSLPQTVIEDDCLPMDQFAVHLMPHLLTLANDRVPNVRVLLAKTLRQTLLEKGGWVGDRIRKTGCGGEAGRRLHGR